MLHRARSTVDGELVAVEKIVTELRARKNTLAPVSVLPQEVLAEIFEMCSRVPEQVFSETRRSFLQSSRWPERLIMARVCRTWRRVAFEHPKVWRNVTLELARPLLEALLPHAKSVPLVMSSRNQRPIPRHNRSLISSNLSRTAEIDILDYQDIIRDISSSFAPTPAPLLRKLRLQSLPKSDSSELILNLNFGNNAPSLTEIHLRALRVHWPSLAVSNLRSLTILNQLVDALDILPSLPSSEIIQFFEAICSAPLLASLNLQNCFRLAAGTLPDIPTMYLRTLTNVTLLDTPFTCEAFLRHITVPLDAKLVIKFTCPPSIPEDYSPLFIPLLRDRLQPELFSIGMVSVVQEMIGVDADELEPSVSVRLWKTDSLDSSNGEIDASEDDAYTHFAFTSPSAAIIAVIDIVPFDTVSALIVSCAEGMTIQKWLGILPAARRVHTAFVGMMAAILLLLALDRAPDDSPLFLPALQYLTISMTNLNWDVGNGINLTIAELIFNVLERRRRDGSGPQRLRIERCWTSVAQIERLRSIPGLEVVWDGNDGLFLPGFDPDIAEIPDSPLYELM
jgi:hypothetical protein